MRARKESDLQNLCCDSQSNKRLQDYRNRLFAGSGEEKPAFDKPVRDVLVPYVYDEHDFVKTIGYLDGLRSPDGARFGRSVPQVEKLQQHLDRYSDPEAPDFRWNQHYRIALAKVLERYSRAQLRPMRPASDDEAWDLFSRVDTSAGLTFILEGYRHKVDFPRDGFLVEAERRENEAISNGSFNSYYLMFTRTSATGAFDEKGEETGTCKVSTRPTWAEDMFMVWSGRKFSGPITAWLQSYDKSSACKTDPYTTRRVFSMRVRFNHYISLDYSAYDGTQPSWLLFDAFRVVESMFRGLTDQEKALLSVIRDDFIHKNLITPFGVFSCDHGDPSGSAFTTIINGICNELITETWAVKFGYRKIDYTIQGDDNLIYGQRSFDVGNIASYILKNFGVKVNESKTSVGSSNENPEYLGGTWTTRGRYRHPHVLISKILYPERFRDYAHKPELDPVLIIYSYILAYEMGMRELMDVERFLEDHALTLKQPVDISWDVKRELPYNVQAVAFEKPLVA